MKISIFRSRVAARAFVVLVCIALAACAPKEPKYGAGVIAGGAPLAPEHTLSPGDEFEIRFPFSPEFNDRAVVGQDGRVSLQRIGEVVVGGLTVPEATARLKERFAKTVRYPELSLTIRAYAPEVVYVDGWVNRAGLLRSEMPLTLARALSRAGGMKPGARTDDILILRRDPEGNVRPVSAALGGFAGAGRPDQDPMLKSFDVVYVPRGPIAVVGEFVNSYVKTMPFSVSARVGAPTPVSTILPPGVVSQPPATRPPSVAPP
jgi:protein involved in polysaccharide export with SLBB domain